MSQVAQCQAKLRQSVLIDEDLSIFRFERCNQLLCHRIMLLVLDGMRRDYFDRYAASA